jgi:hypothetical protein
MGIVTARTQDEAVPHKVYQSLISKYKSRHSGFIDSISEIFFFLDPPLIRFSSSIADSIKSKDRK